MHPVIKRTLVSSYKIFVRFTTGWLDKYYLALDVPSPKNIKHKEFLGYLSKLSNKKGFRVLEIGSREVTGKSLAKQFFSDAEYTGFDYYAGPNVDVVGDAHKLDDYFTEKFDLIYSSAVFEHFAMPWVVAEEIAKILKVGGLVFVETHFSYATHERPWNFFQFSDMGLKALFSPALGFRCIEASMQNPIVGRFSSLADDYLRYMPIKGLYCHSDYLGTKVEDVENFDWRKINVSDVVSSTHYPAPQ